MRGNIITYIEMCRIENASLQRGMNFRPAGRRSIFLMSTRKGAPYRDRVEDDGLTLIYEGHDVPKGNGLGDPKKVDQPGQLASGRLTENGKFFRAAERHKASGEPPELVKVYEKIKDGIWADNGSFQLVDAWLEHDGVRQERDICRLVDLALHFCIEAKSGQPATYAAQRLSRLKNLNWNLEVILHGMFRLAREYPSCVPHVAELLINNQHRCSAYKTKIEQWVKRTIKDHLKHGHDFEVSWALMIASVLQIRLDRATFEPIERTPSSVVFALLGLMSERQLLLFPLSIWPWRAEFKKRGIYAESWLPFYESVRRGWTKDKAMVRAVTSDATLSLMLTNRVTFLEDQIFGTTGIDLSRRVLRGKRAKPTASSTQSTKDNRGQAKRLSMKNRFRVWSREY